MGWKPVARVALGAGLAALLVAFAAREASGLPVPRPLPALAAAAGVLALYGASWVLRARRIAAYAAAAGATVPSGALAALHVQAHAWNVVLPAKAGDAAQVALLARRGVPLRDALVLTGTLRALDLAALLALGLLALAARPSLAGAPGVAVAALGAVALLGGLLLAVLVLPGSRVAARVDAKLPARWRDAGFTSVGVAAAFRALSRRAGLPGVALLSLGVWGLEAASAAYAAHLFGVPPALAVAAMTAASLAKALPLTPGGLGVFEVVFASVVGALGGSAGAGFAAGLFDHGLKTLAVLAAGGSVALAWSFAPRAATEAA